ncbi:NACHT, LRR and PYD domains-containing protein 3-like [Brachyhypopomus gauderio]|uniref:NACHT, LRR and PYD domains-containing protein 3-like n=1 Tax=Brachyhypopomus gauderio TaxID=698409 RepID=UPI004041FAC6
MSLKDTEMMKDKMRRLRLGSESTQKKDNLQNKINDFLSNIFDDLEKKIIVFIKHELEMFKKFLKKANTRFYGDMKEEMWSLRDGVLNMTLYFLKTMDHEDLADALQSELIGIQQRALKSKLSKKYNHVCEGIAKQVDINTLNKIYTDLYITEGVTQLTKEHEVRQIEKKKTRVSDATQMQQEKPIDCKKMFEVLSEQDRPIRTVLTQGVAGIGKSICVQKFVLDWAEGREYQDITFIFPLPFRELNLKMEKYSLMDIISHYFPETKGLRFTDKHKVMFIFDGLDKCRLPLAFQENETWTSVSMPTTLDIVLTNLIKGNLLPSALIWITTRPAAAAKIPAEFIDRVTEVRGFNDEQKVEYFRKRISDENLANKIMDHIKGLRSLFIMCHIPVFCWISATVLQNILEEAESEDTPKTLTDMYTYFLIFQTIQGNNKYSRTNASDIPWDKEGIVSLGKLAFQHLEKNNLIFYSVDLDECGIDPNKISVYSGLCTQETGRFQDTVFSFVHLSIQEFIAAVFAFVRLINDNINVFADHSTSQRSENETEMIHLLQAAVDKALESETGHLDLFLRFLLGLSLESNQKLIRGLLKNTGSGCVCQKGIIDYIKLKFEQNLSPERLINLFYCLNELNDDSLVREIQSYLKSGCLSEAELSPAQWSALVFVLMTSEEDLDEFDLRKFIRSDECLRRLMPVVEPAKIVLLCECNLTERSCSTLLSVLTSESSKLIDLDMSNNSLQDSGVEQLSEGLKSSNCKLKKLKLSDCSITKEGYEALASALKSNPSSHLTDLDLRGNDPGDSGVKKLTEILEDPNCKLNKLRLLSPAAEKFCASLTKSLGSNPLLLREMDLSGKIQGDSGVKQLSDLLEDPHCRPEKLILNNCSITEQGCSTLTSSLHSNPSHLRELHLSGNELGDSGVKQLSALLKHKDCKLQILRLSDCSIKEEGYEALSSALKSNPSSHLTDLDLRGNDPGDSGVKLLTEILEDPNCKLEKLR